MLSLRSPQFPCEQLPFQGMSLPRGLAPHSGAPTSDSRCHCRMPCSSFSVLRLALQPMSAMFSPSIYRCRCCCPTWPVHPCLYLIPIPSVRHRLFPILSSTLTMTMIRLIYLLSNDPNPISTTPSLALKLVLPSVDPAKRRHVRIVCLVRRAVPCQMLDLWASPLAPAAHSSSSPVFVPLCP